MPKSFVFDLIGYVVLCAVAGYVLTRLCGSVALRLDMLDRPDGGRKQHGKAIPLMGGVAVYLTVLGACLVANALQPVWLLQDKSWNRLFPTLLVSAGVVCLVGLWDDKWSMRPRTKFLWQLAAALPWAVAGRVADEIQILGIPIDLGGMLGFAFTLLWLVACANIINLIDGLDGLAGTVGLIISATAAILALNDQMNGAAFVAAVLSASLAGFLLHNWPPAKIFLGDSGSLTLGFLVGALSLEASTKRATGLILTVPIVLMSIPIFDTLMAIVRRKMTGRGIGEGDHAHIHHCLQDRGLSRSRSLWVIAALCTIMAVAAFVSASLTNEWVGLGICGAVLGFLIISRLFGYDETMLFLGHLRGVSQVLSERAGLLKTQLTIVRSSVLQQVPSETIWNELCDLTQAMGGKSLELACRDDRADAMVWYRDRNLPAAEIAPGTRQWQFNYTVQASAQSHVALVVQGTSERPPKGRGAAQLMQLVGTFADLWSRDPELRLAVLPDASQATVESEAAPESAPVHPPGSKTDEHRDRKVA